MNASLPFTSSPDPSPSQNPLSLMMSQMSKYAMPSSTPLYHNAIKTIATSDDELLPDRPLLPPPPPQASGPGAGLGKGPGERRRGRGEWAWHAVTPVGMLAVMCSPMALGLGGDVLGTIPTHTII